jgi:hypothetical protein
MPRRTITLVIERISLGIMSVGSGSTVEVLRWVVGLDGIAGEILCPVCEGSGTFLEPDDTPVQCTDCKDTGRMLVSL